MMDFLAKGTTISGADYASLGRKLLDAIQLKRRGMLMGKRFTDDETLISEVKSWFETQNEGFYKRGLHSCIKRWEKCVTLGGSYVEKD